MNVGRIENKNDRRGPTTRWTVFMGSLMIVPILEAMLLLALMNS